MGGYIDDNGNVFRAKDVLEEDFSDPLLYEPKYLVKGTDVIRTGHSTILNVTLTSLDKYKETRLLLTKEEYNAAVDKKTKGGE